MTKWCKSQNSAGIFQSQVLFTPSLRNVPQNIYFLLLQSSTLYIPSMWSTFLRIMVLDGGTILRIVLFSKVNLFLLWAMWGKHFFWVSGTWWGTHNYDLLMLSQIKKNCLKKKFLLFVILIISCDEEKVIIRGKASFWFLLRPGHDRST